MRMTVRVTLGVLAVMLGTLLTVGIVAAPANAASTPRVAAVHVVHAAGAPATPTPTPQTNYNKGQQQADAALARQKLIIGGVCVVLLVIVWIGHRAKGRHILRIRNLQNAKS